VLTRRAFEPAHGQVARRRASDPSWTPEKETIPSRENAPSEFTFYPQSRWKDGIYGPTRGSNPIPGPFSF
jgi:hypothetical protein